MHDPLPTRHKVEPAHYGFIGAARVSRRLLPNDLDSFAGDATVARTRPVDLSWYFAKEALVDEKIEGASTKVFFVVV